MQIPFLDLRRETDSDRKEIEEAITRVLASGRYILGPELTALESEFADYLRVPCAVGVGSGTDALALALEAACEIHPGRNEEIITSALSAAFSALAICRAGAIPRFADVDSATLQIDPAGIEQCIGENTRAIVPVHLYGFACDMPRIDTLARKHNLFVIEDACQAHGARLHDKALGTLGHAGAFSFYPTKNMGALGDAGMIATRDAEVAARVKKLRHGGQSLPYCHELLGYNSRLDELQAALLRFRLQKLEGRNSMRRQMAARYDAAFGDLELTLLPQAPGMLPNRHLYPVRTARRDELQRFLRELGIETLVHYPLALPSQPALRRFVVPGQQFPAAEKAARDLLSLPLYPELREEECDYIIRSVRQFFKK